MVKWSKTFCTSRNIDFGFLGCGRFVMQDEEFVGAEGFHSMHLAIVVHELDFKDSTIQNFHDCAHVSIYQS